MPKDKGLSTFYREANRDNGWKYVTTIPFPITHHPLSEDFAEQCLQLLKRSPSIRFLRLSVLLFPYLTSLNSELFKLLFSCAL